MLKEAMKSIILVGAPNVINSVTFIYELGITGMLHGVDYAKFYITHCNKSASILKKSSVAFTNDVAVS
jgi:hypothetical protein